MADITMCLKEDCEKKKECYRFMAIPNNKWQSYAQFDDCKSPDYGNYWDVGNRKDIRDEHWY